MAEAMLPAKLNKLNLTPNSIESKYFLRLFTMTIKRVYIFCVAFTAAAEWIMFHKARAPQLVKTWNDLLRNAPNHQLMPFLFVCNDVLQKSKRTT